MELNSGLKNMRVLWEEIKGGWNDPVSRDFEENHWTPLENQVLNTLRAIDRLAPTLGTAQRDCS